MVKADLTSSSSGTRDSLSAVGNTRGVKLILIQPADLGAGRSFGFCLLLLCPRKKILYFLTAVLWYEEASIMTLDLLWTTELKLVYQM